MLSPSRDRIIRACREASGWPHFLAARRSGASNKFPASANPPPITTSSGFSSATMLATPRPRLSPAASRVLRASGSPARAARTTASAVSAPSLRPMPAREPDFFPRAKRAAVRAIAGPPATASRLPSRPNSGRQCSLVATHPAAPATPLAPEITWPSAMVPAPMPVPRVRKTRFRAGRSVLAPSHASASA